MKFFLLFGSLIFVYGSLCLDVSPLQTKTTEEYNQIYNACKNDSKVDLDTYKDIVNFNKAKLENDEEKNLWKCILKNMKALNDNGEVNMEILKQAVKLRLSDPVEIKKATDVVMKCVQAPKGNLTDTEYAAGIYNCIKEEAKKVNVPTPVPIQ